MFQRKLEKLEKYLPYCFRDWTITYISTEHYPPDTSDVMSHILMLSSQVISRVYILYHLQVYDVLYAEHHHIMA